MMSKSFYNRSERTRVNRSRLTAALLAAVFFAPAQLCMAGDAPQWMHAQVNAPVPSHDDKTDAALMYSETNVNVVSPDKIKTVVRRAYKILRPDGREYGLAFAVFRSPEQKINNMRAWCIPAQGKDYEVKDKEAVEGSYPRIEGSELISDLRVKFVRIPAAEPGNIIGFEYEREEQPLVLQDKWEFQEEIPARESHYSLQLPSGWEYRTFWAHYPEVKPAQGGNNQWEWTVTNVKGVHKEQDMPPIHGLLGKMIVSFFPPGGAGQKGFVDWRQMGDWYRNLTDGRREASPDIKQKVLALTANSQTTLEKMRAVANYVQDSVRYVAIELGIGGWQPHSASDVLGHQYGDCKDKATLMSSMLREIGIDSYYVVINSQRGSVTSNTPAHTAFNHVILAIKLPESLADDSLISTLKHPRLGTILFFDPTNELTPLGQISGHLQANYGLLVTPDGGELIQLPKQPASMNSVRRIATLTLDEKGRLQGEVQETRLGDRASAERWRLRSVTRDNDRIKPIENLLAASLSSFRITKATITNLNQSSLPFGFNYSFQADDYAKTAGDLLLVRPRVIGVKAQGILETKEPRQFPIEFDSPLQDTDSFEIILPAGYEVDDLPPPVAADYEFATYHSKTEAKGNTITYTRTFEIKELSVPVSKAEELKKFYRIIATDERNTAILKPAPSKLGKAQGSAGATNLVQQ